jgi:hypothetical protein
MGAVQKKVKKKTDQQIKEALRKRCVKMAKDISKERAGYKCQYDGCARSKDNGFQMHGSHIYGENSNKSMSADPENILCLCAVHHTGGFWKNAKEISWHESPIEMAEWFMNKFPERYKQLRERSRISIVCDEFYWKKKLEELKKLSTDEQLDRL